MMLISLSESELISTLLSLALLLTSAFVFGKLFEKILKAPRVIGEIVGGMLFGATGLFHFFPSIIQPIFMAYPEQGKVLNIFYQLGLIFLMFCSGYNTEIKVEKSNIRLLLFLFAGATILPMLGAIPFAGLFANFFIGESGNYTSYVLVFLISVAITSIPVISRIFFDMNIMNSNFANTVLTVSTIQDLCLWVLLNIAYTISKSEEINILKLTAVIIITIAMFVIVKIASLRLVKIRVSLDTQTLFTLAFIVLLFATAILSLLSINVMYSAFIIGYIFQALSSMNKELRPKIDHIAEFSSTFLVPIYFALVGIQLDLIKNLNFGRLLLFFLIAFTLEAAGTVIMLLFTNLKKRVIINFAVTMNARGGPGIVLATIAFSYGIISEEYFTALILVTMISSTLAGYWLKRQQKVNPQIFELLFNCNNTNNKINF